MRAGREPLCDFSCALCFFPSLVELLSRSLAGSKELGGKHGEDWTVHADSPAKPKRTGGCGWRGAGNRYDSGLDPLEIWENWRVFLCRGSPLFVRRNV